MQRTARKITELPALFVFLSFVIGLLNFGDTFLRLLFSYMLPFSYPLGVYLKPIFFVLQVICLVFFLYFIVTNKQSFSHNDSRILLMLQLALLATVIFLFFYYVLANPGRFGIMVYYTDTIWLFSYILGISGTSFWFFSQLLKESQYQTFATVFLLIGLAFASSVVGEIYFWPQTLFNISLPPEVDIGSRLLTTTLILLALFCTFGQLSVKRNIAKSHTILLKSVQLIVLFLILLLPLFLAPYRGGLFNMIVRAVVYWGLGYSGDDWYFAGLYLAAFATYLFLVMELNKRLDHSLASNLILLGVVSFPWNGIWVFNFGYSSIPGNMLSLSALIVGFFLLKENHKKLNSSIEHGATAGL